MILTDIIASYISGKEYTLPENADISVLYAVSKSHDLAHLLAAALEKYGITAPSETKDELKKQKLLAVYRREQLDYEEERICNALQKVQIAHIPLKGAVIKRFYPEKWMRTSCDIDILIHPEDKAVAISQLCEQLGYVQKSDSARECSLVSKSGVNLELHFSLEFENEKTNSVLSRVWNYAIANDGCSYTLSNDFFVFYHIAHMLVHFTEGGCGIRPFIDLWLFKKANDTDENALLTLLKESESFTFYKSVCALCDVWFNGKAHTELTAMLEEYVVTGGVYGSRKNLGSTSIHKKGGFFKYLVSRIFMPKEKLRLVYPKIDKYPILIPYYWVKRWFTLFNKNKFKAAKSELAGNKKAKSTDELFCLLGL